MTDQNRQTWIPEFCRLPTLFSLMVICELVVVLLELGYARSLVSFIDQLSISSLFVQWLALLIAVTMCGLRDPLSRLPLPLAMTIAFLLILSLTASLTWAAVNYAGLVGFDTVGPVEPWVTIGRNVLIAALVTLAAGRYFYIQHRWKQQVESLARAEVRTLQARIRPHFLFNSMNTIASLIHSKPDVAEACIENLSELFRAALNSLDKTNTLSTEMSLCRQYLDIESLRLGDRLVVDWQVDEPLPDIQLPPLTIQPLFENAIYHGISQLAQPGTVSVHGRVVEGHWELCLKNPVPSSSVTDHNPGHQLAIENIRQRLSHLFDGASLKMQLLDHEFSATMRLPLNKQHQT